MLHSLATWAKSGCVGEVLSVGVEDEGRRKEEAKEVRGDERRTLPLFE